MVQKDTCTPMFIAALFTIARTWIEIKAFFFLPELSLVKTASEERYILCHI